MNKGKGVADSEPIPDDSNRAFSSTSSHSLGDLPIPNLFLFKKANSTEDDDITILDLMVDYVCDSNNPEGVPSAESVRFHDYIERIVGHDVDEKRLTAKILGLEDKFRRLVDGNGEIRDALVAEEIASGKFSQKSFESSQILWGKKPLDHPHFFLFPKSQSSQQDYLQTLKFVHLFFTSRHGGFNPSQYLADLYGFIVNKFGRKISFTKLQRNVLDMEDLYRTTVREKGKNPDIPDPLKKEIFGLMTSIWGNYTTEDQNMATRVLQTGHNPYDKNKNTAHLSGFPYTTYLFNINTKEAGPEPRDLIFKASRTSRDDDVIILSNLYQYLLNSEIARRDHDFQTFLSRLGDRILELEIDYQMLKAEHGEIKPNEATKLEFLGILDGPTYEMSQKIWGKKRKAPDSLFGDLASRVGYRTDRFHDVVISLMEIFANRRPVEIVDALGDMRAGRAEEWDNRLKQLGELRATCYTDESELKRMEDELKKEMTEHIKLALPDIDSDSDLDSDWAEELEAVVRDLE